MQLSKAQQDKAAAEAARRKKGEAAKARAAEEARQKAAEAAAAAKDPAGEMDGRMLSALITGARRSGWATNTRSAFHHSCHVVVSVPCGPGKALHGTAWK